MIMTTCGCKCHDFNAALFHLFGHDAYDVIPAWL